MNTMILENLISNIVKELDRHKSKLSASNYKIHKCATNKLYTYKTTEAPPTYPVRLWGAPINLILHNIHQYLPKSLYLLHLSDKFRFFETFSVQVTVVIHTKHTFFNQDFNISSLSYLRIILSATH